VGVVVLYDKPMNASVAVTPVGENEKEEGGKDDQSEKYTITQNLKINGTWTF
jgi:hypothetical protein